MSGLGGGLTAINRIFGWIQEFKDSMKAAADWGTAMLKKFQSNKAPVIAHDDAEAEREALLKQLEEPKKDPAP